MNYAPISNTTCVGYEYLVSQVVSITLNTASALLVLISAISIHDITISIIMTHHNMRCGASCILALHFVLDSS
eukprot:15341882-Ditylum_brightwellii.AAC.1